MFNNYGHDEILGAICYNTVTLTVDILGVSILRFSSVEELMDWVYNPFHSYYID